MVLAVYKHSYLSLLSPFPAVILGRVRGRKSGESPENVIYDCRQSVSLKHF